MIIVSRLVDPPSTGVSIEELPPLSDAIRGQDIAVWQAGLEGLGWIDALVAAGQAVGQGNGYPYTYFARARDVTPHLAGRPYENAPWKMDAGDIVSEQWMRGTTIDHETAEAIEADEWLHVTAWDES